MKTMLKSIIASFVVLLWIGVTQGAPHYTLDKTAPHTNGYTWTVLTNTVFPDSSYCGDTYFGYYAPYPVPVPNANGLSFWGGVWSWAAASGRFGNSQAHIVAQLKVWLKWDDPHSTPAGNWLLTRAWNLRIGTMVAGCWAKAWKYGDNAPKGIAWPTAGGMPLLVQEEWASDSCATGTISGQRVVLTVNLGSESEANTSGLPDGDAQSGSFHKQWSDYNPPTAEDDNFDNVNLLIYPLW